MKKIILAIACVVFAPTVWACSAIPPEYTFIEQFDKNKDGVLSKAEFKTAKQTDDYKVDFKLANMKAFKQLDRDKNRQLSREELQQHVDYVRHPCAGWEEMIHQLHKQHSQHTTPIEQ